MISVAVLPLGFLLGLLLIRPSSKLNTDETVALLSASAGAFAVVTAAISAWIATRVSELQEDSLRPYPYPYFDARSRTGLLLVAVKNFGGSAAHDVRAEWEEPSIDSHGERIRFGVEGVIPILLPGEVVSRIVDGSIQYFARKTRSDYRGIVSFKDSSDRDRRLPFRASAEKFSRTPVYEDEAAQTHEKLQSLPNSLEEIASKLNDISDALQNLGSKRSA